MFIYKDTDMSFDYKIDIYISEYFCTTLQYFKEIQVISR